MRNYPKEKKISPKPVGTATHPYTTKNTRKTYRTLAEAVAAETAAVDAIVGKKPITMVYKLMVSVAIRRPGESWCLTPNGVSSGEVL